MVTTTAQSQQSSPDTISLSRLDLSKMKQGWGLPQVDKSVTGGPLSIAGKKFQHGVGTHSVSRLWIDLHGAACKFLAFVGVDDSALSHPGSVDFKIIGDGKKLWQSGVMKPGEPARSVAVDLRGVKQLVLLVGDGSDGSDYDHADWAEARFVVKGATPTATDIPVEPALVLTPKPGPQPRINGAKIFGVRPDLHSCTQFQRPATAR